ncbi:MAG: MCE family protein [Burkholderiales bacterium]|nr:MCE family protein [Burkholderiales bacterium]
MENKAHALAAGIFVVALAALLMVLAGWLTRERGLRDTYEISTRETITGLQPQAPVKLRGVDVGKVSKIGFDTKVPGNVLLRLEVDEDVKLTKDTFATLSYQGITGLAFIQLSDHGKPAPQLVPNDDAPPRIPLEQGFMSKLETKGEVILEQVEQVTTRMNRLLNDENQKRFTAALASLDGAAGSAKQLAERLDNSVQKQLDPTLAHARNTLKSVDQAADEVAKTAAEFDRTAKRLNEKDGPLDKLGQGTDSLAGAAERFSITTLPRLNRTAEEAGRTLRQVRRTVNDLGDNPQQLIYGEGKPEPGPGEPGFRAPGGPR